MDRVSDFMHCGWSLVAIVLQTARGVCGLRDSHSKFFFSALKRGYVQFA